MTENISDRFVKVEFERFKAFKSFRVDLKSFNILVGPNVITHPLSGGTNAEFMLIWNGVICSV
jgi:hypothetical protein